MAVGLGLLRFRLLTVQIPTPTNTSYPPQVEGLSASGGVKPAVLLSEPLSWLALQKRTFSTFFRRLLRSFVQIHLFRSQTRDVVAPTVLTDAQPPTAAAAAALLLLRSAFLQLLEPADMNPEEEQRRRKEERREEQRASKRASERAGAKGPPPCAHTTGQQPMGALASLSRPPPHNCSSAAH